MAHHGSLWVEASGEERTTQVSVVLLVRLLLVIKRIPSRPASRGKDVIRSREVWATGTAVRQLGIFAHHCDRLILDRLTLSELRSNPSPAQIVVESLRASTNCRHGSPSFCIHSTSVLNPPLPARSLAIPECGADCVPSLKKLAVSINMPM